MNKYSSTPRIINVTLFTILSAGFLFLGSWFGFSVGCNLIVPHTGVTDYTQMSVATALMLASVGWVGGLLSVRGLIYSIKSLANQNDDKSVVESFCSYIAIGFALAIALILNGTWLIRLTTTDVGYTDIGFLVAAYIVVAIIVLVVSNVPVLKLFDEGEDSGSMLKLFCTTAFYIFLGILVPYLVMTVDLLVRYWDSQHFILHARFLILCGLLLVSTVLSGIGCLKAKKASEEKQSKAAGGLMLSSITVSGLFLLASGIFENVLEGEKDTTILGKLFRQANENWLGYAVGCYIIGSILIIGSIVIMLVAKFGKPKKAKSNI